MAIVTLEEMKDYLRIERDFTDEDETIQFFLDSAEEYVKNATGFTFEKEVPETAKLIVKLLASHWYDHRAIITTSPNMYKIAFTVEVLLNQLKYSYSEDDK